MIYNIIMLVAAVWAIIALVSIFIGLYKDTKYCNKIYREIDEMKKEVR